MEKKKLSTSMICHLVLMGLLCLINLASAVIVLSGNTPGGFAVTGAAGKTTLILDGIALLINALALCCGILYLVRGGGKQDAAWYKAFILQVALGVTLRMIGTILFPGFGAPTCLMIGIIITLLLLALVPNLGRQNTWIVFYIGLALQIVLAIVIFEKAEALSSIVGSGTRLVLHGTIGLLIQRKYADKAARGR